MRLAFWIPLSACAAILALIPRLGSAADCAVDSDCNANGLTCGTDVCTKSGACVPAGTDPGTCNVVADCKCYGPYSVLCNPQGHYCTITSADGGMNKGAPDDAGTAVPVDDAGSASMDDEAAVSELDAGTSPSGLDSGGSASSSGASTTPASGSSGGASGSSAAAGSNSGSASAGQTASTTSGAAAISGGSTQASKSSSGCAAAASDPWSGSFVPLALTVGVGVMRRRRNRRVA